MKYYDGTTPLYSGNISEWSWTQKGQTENSYKFSYDNMSRLLGADHYIGTTKVDKFTEKAIAYDKNSNLTSMTRYVNGTANALTFTYSGNKRTGYAYDNNGNISKDAANNLEISYNLFNLPAVIREGSTAKATYTYLADSCKYRTINSSGTGYDYVGSFRYNRNGSNITLESVAGSGGRIYKTSSSYEARYFVSDHLGSTRLVANSAGTVLEQNDYMPYGERHANSALATSTNPYLYNGKESQKDFGINYIDSEARFQRLDGAFNSIDPKAEEFYWVSPYVYCAGNPIGRVDEDGNKWVNSRGFLKYQDGKWTKYATAMDKQIGRELQNTPTGYKAFKYLVESNIPTDVQYGNLEYQTFGQTRNSFVANSENVNWAVIILDLPQIEEKAKDEGLLIMQAVASTLGHEVRHTEPENIKMQIDSYESGVRDYDKLEEERDASRIGDQIIYEYKNNIRHVEKNSNNFWNRLMELFRKGR